PVSCGYTRALLSFPTRRSSDLIGVGGGTIHIAGMGKQVSGTPQDLDVVFGLFVQRIVGYEIESFPEFRKVCSLLDQVHVVKAVIRNPEFGDEFEGCVHFLERSFFSGKTFVPGQRPRTPSEWIATISAEAMPVGYGKSKVVGHAFGTDHFIGIVKPIGEGVGGIGSFVPNGWNMGKVGLWCMIFHNAFSF